MIVVHTSYSQFIVVVYIAVIQVYIPEKILGRASEADVIHIGSHRCRPMAEFYPQYAFMDHLPSGDSDVL